MVDRARDREPAEPTAEAHLYTAQQYHLAANKLFAFGQEVEMPLYFLYAHTIELALKAFLRSLGERVPRIHTLPALSELCGEHGLKVSSDVLQVISLLDSETRFHGFRYFAFVNAGKPSLDYLREAVDELMAIVSERVSNAPGDRPVPGAVVKLTVQKPVKK